MIPNINEKTGVRYGTVALNSLADWVPEEFTNKGTNLTYKVTLEEWRKENPDGDEDDFSNSYEAEEEDYELEIDGMELLLGWLGGAGLVWVCFSPFKTRASPCSPCVPGAGDLDSQHDAGVECYTLPKDWFLEKVEG